MEGDHTGHSMDSNTFGPIPLDIITAKATCIVWPPSRWQSLNKFVPDNRTPVKNFIPDDQTSVNNSSVLAA